MVVRVAHDLKLDFLVAFNAFLDENLVHRGETKGIDTDIHKLLLVICKTAARASERKRRTKNNRVADSICSCPGLVQTVGDFGRYDRFSDGLAHLLKQLPVFGAFNRAGTGTKELGSAFAENTFTLQLHCQIQTRLASNPGDYGVRTFISQNLGNIVQRQGFHVYFVRNHCICHDRCGVGIDENDFITLLTQCEAGLRAGVIELSRLPDDDWTGTNDQYFLDISSF